MAMKSAYLIDYSNMIYRFRSALSYAKADVNGVTVDTSTLVGYTRSLKSNFYDDIFICLDGVPQRFFDILPGYKGQRQFDPSESLSVSFSETIKFLTKIGTIIGKNVKVVASPGQEADQVISSLAHIGAGLAPPNQVFYTKAHYGMNVSLDSDPHLKKLSNGVSLSVNEYNFNTSIIASTDSDMYQLLQYDNIHIDASTNGRRLLPRDKTPDMVKNIPPSCIPAYKMIVGDNSDNVPNINIGISDDRLIKIITAYLNTNELVSKFIMEIRMYNGSIDTLSKIKPVLELQMAIIKSGNFLGMMANYEVTKLVYNSTPFELQYPDYDIQETIKKYKLVIK